MTVKVVDLCFTKQLGFVCWGIIPNIDLGPECTRVYVPFDPIPLVVKYKVVVRSSDNKNYPPTITTVLDNLAMPWGDFVANEAFIGDYQNGEDFQAYFTRQKKNLFKTELNKYWMNWEAIRTWQLRCNVSFCDRSFIESIVVNGKPTELFKYDRVAELYPPIERGKVGVFECLKHIMLREGQWVPERLCFVNQYTSQPSYDQLMEMVATKQVVVINQEKMALVPVKPEPIDLVEHVPVDFAIRAGRRWNKIPCLDKKLDRFLPLVKKHNNQSKGGLNNRLHVISMDLYKLEAIISEIRATKVLYVFPDYETNKNWYETIETKWMPKRVMRHRKSNALVLVEPKGDSYEISKTGRGKGIPIQRKTLFTEYRSFRTCLYTELEGVNVNWFDLIFCFSSRKVPRRWPTWVNHLCGDATYVCVVGQFGAFH